MTKLLQFLHPPILAVVCHLALLLSTASVSSMAASSPLPAARRCHNKCGGIEIPYPFGLSDECAWPGGGDFTVACNHSFNPPRPYTGNIEITSISVETGEMEVYGIVASVCYNSSNTTDFYEGIVDWTLVPPFVISPTENVFTAIGCEALAFLQGGSDWDYYTGCITYCASLKDSAQDGDPCTGLGCCQTSIPGNLSTLEVYWTTDNNTVVSNPAWEYSPCKNAFVAKKDWYNFNRADLKGKGKDSFGSRVGDRSAPLVLDWAIRGNGSCMMLPGPNGPPGKLTAPACASTKSYCQDLNATQGGGYLCMCTKGYMGNPYIVDGCTNINECTDPRYANTTANGPCGMYTKCKDTDGDYICECNRNRKGDGKSEKGCYQYKFPPYAMVAVATLAAIVLACFAVILLHRRNRRVLFNNNGGKILAAQGITIFTKTEIHQITKGYSKRLGGGHFGVVYQGSIDSAPAQLVAVKCSVGAQVARNWHKIIQYVVPQHKQQYQQEDNGFVNEIIFQFKIRHANVVKLIGCCLETHIPILVFEFISNGSLDDALHGTVKPSILSLLNRLDIAIGSADALTHMHSHGDHVHGDMKPANILLDKDFNPKVSDFGSSKLLSINSYTRAVAADMSYIDPVYMKTERFTVKSDVYSFGVVLLELITRKTAKYDENKSLPLDFIKCFKDEGTGMAMYDREILSGDDAESESNIQCLDMIGTLAVRCLKEDVEERPTMSEVLEELKQIKVIASAGSSCSESS